MDVGQGLGAAGAEPRGVRLDRARPSGGKCTTLPPHAFIVTLLCDGCAIAPRTTYNKSLDKTNTEFIK